MLTPCSAACMTSARCVSGRTRTATTAKGSTTTRTLEPAHFVPVDSPVRVAVRIIRADRAVHQYRERRSQHVEAHGSVAHANQRARRPEDQPRWSTVFEVSLHILLRGILGSVERGPEHGAEVVVRSARNSICPRQRRKNMPPEETLRASPGPSGCTKPCGSGGSVQRASEDATGVSMADYSCGSASPPDGPDSPTDIQPRTRKGRTAVTNRKLHVRIDPRSWLMGPFSVSSNPGSEARAHQPVHAHPLLRGL